MRVRCREEVVDSIVVPSQFTLTHSLAHSFVFSSHLIAPFKEYDKAWFILLQVSLNLIIIWSPSAGAFLLLMSWFEFLIHYFNFDKGSRIKTLRAIKGTSINKKTMKEHKRVNSMFLAYARNLCPLLPIPSHPPYLSVDERFQFGWYWNTRGVWHVDEYCLSMLSTAAGASVVCVVV